MTPRGKRRRRQGELTLVANGERYDAEFDIDASGKDDVALAGDLRWFALDEE